MHTSIEWWNAVKAEPVRLHRWLQRQYVGELAAVSLLSELLIRFGGEATDAEWRTVHKIMVQEANHARWIKGLLDARGITPEPFAAADQRYWAEVLPAIHSFAEATAAGFHAEHMRLQRIRAIAWDADAPEDVREVFQRILPQEEFHERAFDAMRSGRAMTRYHEAGLRALDLTLV